MLKEVTTFKTSVFKTRNARADIDELDLPVPSAEGKLHPSHLGTENQLGVLRLTKDSMTRMSREKSPGIFLGDAM
jgi:hypothetical protein